MPGFSLRSQDAWRNHPMLASGFKRPIPNFTLACGIFLGLVAVDWANKAINGTNKLCTRVKSSFRGLSGRSQSWWRVTTGASARFPPCMYTSSLLSYPFLSFPGITSLPTPGDGHHHANPVSVTFVDDIDGPSTTVIEESKGSHGARH